MLSLPLSSTLPRDKIHICLKLEIKTNTFAFELESLKINASENSLYFNANGSFVKGKTSGLGNAIPALKFTCNVFILSRKNYDNKKFG